MPQTDFSEFELYHSSEGYTWISHKPCHHMVGSIQHMESRTIADLIRTAEFHVCPDGWGHSK